MKGSKDVRPSIDEYFTQMATLVASRGTCARRLVGCVLTNRHRHVIATGYNGVPSGLPHCRGAGDGGQCSGAAAAPGQSLDACMAIHAEQNALLQCPDMQDIETAYVTASPCITCTKLLLNTSCRRIVFSEEYPHPSARDLWLQAGREWIKFEG